MSYHTNLAAGGTIVLIVTAWFLLSLVIAPRHGLISRLRRPGRAAAGDPPADRSDEAGRVPVEPAVPESSQSR